METPNPVIDGAAAGDFEEMPVAETTPVSPAAAPPVVPAVSAPPAADFEALYNSEVEAHNETKKYHAESLAALQGAQATLRRYSEMGMSFANIHHGA